MVSSFTLMVARGVGVPVLDPRLRTHVRFRVVPSQVDEPATKDDAKSDQQALAEMQISDRQD